MREHRCRVEMGGRASRAASSGGAFEIDEDEEASRGCCGCFAKGVSCYNNPPVCCWLQRTVAGALKAAACSGQVCSTFIALAMLASAGLSAAAILRSKDDFWVLFDTKGATPAYHIQCACAPPARVGTVPSMHRS